MAQALEGGAIEKPPWYEPSDDVPTEPVIRANSKMELDSLVVDAATTKANGAAGKLSEAPRQR
jgi:hypothetical protein